MNTGQGKSYSIQGGVGVGLAFLVGAGVSVAVGSILPLLLALGFALAVGGSTYRPYVPEMPPGGREGSPNCDFCHQRPVTWTYPCESFSHGLPPYMRAVAESAGIPQGINSIGAWAADDPCHGYIESNAWELMFERYWNVSPSAQLLRAIPRARQEALLGPGRSIKTEMHRAMLHPIDEEVERGIPKGLWVMFQEHRTGPPYPAGPFG